MVVIDCKCVRSTRGIQLASSRSSPGCVPEDVSMLRNSFWQQGARRRQGFPRDCWYRKRQWPWELGHCRSLPQGVRFQENPGASQEAWTGCPYGASRGVPSDERLATSSEVSRRFSGSTTCSSRIRFALFETYLRTQWRSSRMAIMPAWVHLGAGRGEEQAGSWMRTAFFGSVPRHLWVWTTWKLCWPHTLTILLWQRQGSGLTSTTTSLSTSSRRCRDKVCL